MTSATSQAAQLGGQAGRLADRGRGEDERRVDAVVLRTAGAGGAAGGRRGCRRCPGACAARRRRRSAAARGRWPTARGTGSSAPWSISGLVSTTLACWRTQARWPRGWCRRRRSPPPAAVQPRAVRAPELVLGERLGGEDAASAVPGRTARPPPPRSAAGSRATCPTPSRWRPPPSGRRRARSMASAWCDHRPRAELAQPLVEPRRERAGRRVAGRAGREEPFGRARAVLAGAAERWSSEPRIERGEGDRHGSGREQASQAYSRVGGRGRPVPGRRVTGG